MLTPPVPDAAGVCPGPPRSLTPAHPGVSRQAEVYLLAANYLQTLEWRCAPELTKNIVLFYTKAGAHDSLARFYESCAELEIDATKDYAKALQVCVLGAGVGGQGVCTVTRGSSQHGSRPPARPQCLRCRASVQLHTTKCSMHA